VSAEGIAADATVTAVQAVAVVAMHYHDWNDEQFPSIQSDY
jgi:hypothetical protein